MTRCKKKIEIVLDLEDKLCSRKRQLCGKLCGITQCFDQQKRISLSHEDAYFASINDKLKNAKPCTNILLDSFSSCLLQLFKMIWNQANQQFIYCICLNHFVKMSCDALGDRPIVSTGGGGRICSDLCMHVLISMYLKVYNLIGV